MQVFQNKCFANKTYRTRGVHCLKWFDVLWKDIRAPVPQQPRKVQRFITNLKLAAKTCSKQQNILIVFWNRNIFSNN